MTPTEQLPELTKEEQEQIEREADAFTDYLVCDCPHCACDDSTNVERGYIAGASLERRRAKADRQGDNGGWIAVEERLPEAGLYVIIEGGMGFQMSGVWWSIMDEGTNNPLPVKWTVTHWMPYLPRPRRR